MNGISILPFNISIKLFAKVSSDNCLIAVTISLFVIVLFNPYLSFVRLKNCWQELLFPITTIYYCYMIICNFN